MTQTKAQPSLVATQRAGQALDADFCCWHAQLVDAELVASCTPENCPLQQAQTDHGGVKNPALIVLLPGVALADLKQAFSKRDWHLLKNSLPALRSALNQLVSKHPASALPEMGAAQPNVLSPHGREPGSSLAGISKHLVDTLVDTLAPSLVWIGLSEQETREGLHSLLSDIAPSSSMQVQLLCNFMHSHFQGFKLFTDYVPFISEQKTLIPYLPATHDTGLKLLDTSLTHLNHLAQLVRCEPLLLDLPQRRLQQKGLLAHDKLSISDGFQETFAVSDSLAADLMSCSFIQTLTPFGLTQKEESLQQIYSLLYAMPCVEPIEALLKLQRLLLSLITHRLGDLTFPLVDPASTLNSLDSLLDFLFDDPVSPPGNPASPFGDPASPFCDPASPSGDPASPSGDPASPSGDPASPSGDPAFPSGDPAFPSGEGPGRDQLLVRYHQALTRRDKALKNWCACRDGAAASPHTL